MTKLAKRRIVEEYDRRVREGEPHGQKDLAQWAQATFETNISVHQGTISRILRTRDALFSPDGIEPSATTRRNRPVTHRGFDRAMAEWVIETTENNLPMSLEIIQNRGRRLRDIINASLPEDKQIKLTMSNGWVQSFCKRWQFKKFKKSSQQAAVKDEAYEEGEMERLKELLKVIKDKSTFAEIMSACKCSTRLDEN